MTSKANLQTLSRHPGVDRRRLIGAMGALGASSFLGAGDALAQDFVLRPEVFGRMFPTLDPFFERASDERASDGLNRALIAIGKRGGVLDAGD